MTVLTALFGAVIGALVGGIATYATTRLTMKLNLEHAYDQLLQAKRLEHYQELFYVSRCIPRFWLPGDEPTRKDLLRHRESFSRWYFSEKAGGMFLTPDAKKLYLNTLNLLVQVGMGDQDTSEGIDDAAISSAESHELRTLVSELRHKLAEDVGAANRPRLRWTALGQTYPPPLGIED